MGLNLFEKPAVVVVDVGFAFNQKPHALGGVEFA